MDRYQPAVVDLVAAVASAQAVGAVVADWWATVFGLCWWAVRQLLLAQVGTILDLDHQQDPLALPSFCCCQLA